MKEVTEYKGLFHGYCPKCGSDHTNKDYGFIPAALYCHDCGWTEARKEKEGDQVEVLVVN